jgi:hypothetical protein
MNGAIDMRTAWRGDRSGWPRAQTTQIVDGVIISMANLPGWFVRRLDAAFDEVLAAVRA